VLVTLRWYHIDRFDREINRCRGMRALLELLKNTQVDVVARIAPLVRDMSKFEALSKELFDADGIIVLAQMLHWVHGGHARAVNIIRDGVASITTLLKTKPEVVVADIRRAKVWSHLSAILSHSVLSPELGPSVLELLHSSTLNVQEVQADLQNALFEQRALFPLLELCYHPDVKIKEWCFSMLVVACHLNERNKAVLRERQALSYVID
jgi:hypothetical protein